jgi:hypothetical protein
MLNLDKVLFNIIAEYLPLSDFFRVKQLNSQLKKKLEETQYLVFKREAFHIFCPLLFDTRNPFVYVPILFLFHKY